jgi:hypothetical protein
MQPPDLATLELAFQPETLFYTGDYDPAALIEALKQAPGLADFDDELGNRQSAVRLDNADDGYWITTPEGTPQAIIDAAVAAYQPPAPTPTGREPDSHRS